MYKLYLDLFAKLFLLLSGVMLYLYPSSLVSNNVLVAAIGISSLYLGTQRDFYLPFLGQTVMPMPSESRISNPISVVLTGLPARTKVVYWASLPNQSVVSDHILAYGDYTNSGVTLSDDKGEAIVQVSCPAPYNVKQFGILNKTIPQHVHYRYELATKGMLSSVRTKYLDKCS